MAYATKNGEEESELRKGPWTIEEDRLLIHYIARHGEGQWNILAKQAGLKRTGKSCRLRWLNYLKPDVKRGNLTVQEQLLILQLHSKLGNRWSKIAQQLPGRTDNEIKNYWRTRVQKQARQLKIDSNSNNFFDTIRYLCKPSIIQAMDQTSNSFNFSSSLSSSSSSSSFHIPSLQSSSQTPYLPSNSSLPFLQPPSSSSDHGGEAQGLVQSSAVCRWPEVAEQPPNPSAEFSGFPHRTQILNDDLEVENRNFDLFSAWEVADFDGQMAANDWLVEDDMVESLWNLDV